MVRARPSSLRGRLILLVLVAVLPVVAGIFYSGYLQRRAAMEAVESEALALARSAAGEEERLVAEGVETEEQLATLRELGSTPLRATSSATRWTGKTPRRISPGITRMGTEAG